MMKSVFLSITATYQVKDHKNVLFKFTCKMANMPAVSPIVMEESALYLDQEGLWKKVITDLFERIRRKALGSDSLFYFIDYLLEVPEDMTKKLQDEIKLLFE